MLASFHKLEIDAIQKQTLKSQQPYFRDKKILQQLKLENNIMVNGVCQKWLKIVDQKLVLLVSAIFWSFSYYFTAMIFFEFIHIFLSKFPC